MNTDALAVQITADGSSAQSELQALENRMSTLEAAYNRAGGAVAQTAKHIDGFATSSAHAAVKAEEAGNAVQKIGGFMADVGTHTRVATQALHTLGLDAGAAAAKVDGLTQLFQGMGGAIPSLLAVGAAITAVFASFELAKGAVAEAAQWDQEMAILGQTVRNQSGDWKTLEASVVAFADAQERTTQFSRGQAVQALTLLTSTGMHLRDAMIVTRVAEDASAASGRSLQEVEHGLMEAMHGRAQALTMLGIGTKQSIHDGMKFKDVLKAIEHSMGGAAAAAADTYAGKVKQLHNSIEKLQQDIGEKMLPYLKDIVSRIKDFVDEVDRDLPKIEDQFKRAYMAIRDVFSFIAQHKAEFEAFFDVVVAVKATQAIMGLRAALIASGGLEFALQTVALLLSGDFAAAVSGVVASNGLLLLSYETIGTFINMGFIPALQALITEEAVASLGITAAIGGIIVALENWKSVTTWVKEAWNAMIWAVGDGMDKLLGWIPGVDQFAKHLEAVGLAGEKAAMGLDALARARGDKGADMGGSSAGGWGSPGVDLSQLSNDLGNTMVGGKLGGSKHQKTPFVFSPGAIALKSPIADEVRKERDIIAAAIDSIKLHEAQLQHAMERTTTVAGYEAASHALAAQKIADHAKEIKLLTAAVAHDTSERVKAEAALSSTTSEYERAYHAWILFGDSLSKDPSKDQRAHLAALAKNVAHAKTSYDNAYTSLQKFDTELDAHKKALDAATIAAEKDKDATAELARKWDSYYQKTRDLMAQDLATADMTNAQKYLYFKALFDRQSRDTVEGEKQAEKLYGEELSAYKGMLHDKESALKAFTDKAVTFLDDFFKKGKHGTQTLAKAFQDMIKTMEQALEKSALMELLGKIFGVPTAGFGSLFESNLFGALGVGGLFGGGAAGGFPAGSGGLGGLASIIGSVTGTPGESAVNALHVNVAGFAPGLFTSSGGASAMGFATVLGGAFGLGAGIGGMEGAGSGAQNLHELYGGIGSLIGVGALGLAAGWGGGLGAGLGALLGAGPAGWALLLGAGLLGGAAGGLFGPNWGPPSNYPDRSNTQSYGQFVSNWVGASGSYNGQTIAPQQQYASKATDEAAQMIAWAQANPSNPVAQQLLALGSSGTDLGITNEHNGVFTLQDGKTVDVSTLMSLAAQWQKLTHGKGSASLLPVYNVTHSFPDWQNPTVALGGNYSPGSPFAGPPNGPGGTNPTNPTSPSNPPIPGKPIYHLPPITINVGGLVGVTKDELAKSVSESIADVVQRYGVNALQTTF